MLKHAAYLVSLLVLAVPSARAHDWPRMDGEGGRECTQALALAHEMFQSSAFVLYAPPAPNAQPAPVLGPEGSNPVGAAVRADPALFDQLGEAPDARLYWQKQAAPAYRLALQASPFGWRGDQYVLLTVDPRMPAQALQERLGAGEDAAAMARIDTGWLPPQLYRDPTDGQLWALTVGQPWQFLDAWQVYAPATQGLRLACTIRFRPPVKHAFALLPAPVRRLAAMLDRTLGSGEGEGTLQPTARLRTDVGHAWANVALRPWADWTPYNSRAAVDRGLAQWAGLGVVNRRQLDQIRRQYPRAEQALARHYRTLGSAPELAGQQAQRMLDLALRAHYVFAGADVKG